MNRIFKIRLSQDNIYNVFEEGISGTVFSGTIEEVNAWISLRLNGFDF